MKTLHEILKPYHTDKGLNGFGLIYESYFSPLRDKEINFLEIGVSLWRGSSLRVFKEYFTKANVIGMDVNSIIGWDESNNFFLGDQTVPDHLDRIIKKFKNFDVIIDDGSHFQWDITFSLNYLFPYLNSGGVYIIEDICSKDNLEKGDDWWGGRRKDMDAAVDVVCYNYTKTEKWESSYLSDAENDYLTSNIEKIDYYPDSKGLNKSTSPLAIIIKK